MINFIKRKEDTMENNQIAHDDIQDVAELTDKLGRCISDILCETDHQIAISALMTATINSILNQCDNNDQVRFYQSLIHTCFDTAIERSKSILLP